MGNVFGNIPSDLSEEVFEKLAGNEKVTIERIVSNGHCSPDDYWYDQVQNEWIIVLQGQAKLEFDDGRVIELSQGDYHHIPAHEKHRVAWTSVEVETIWLAVFY